MTSDPPSLVTPVRPWLSQGDIFASVPVLDISLTLGSPVARLPVGPAILITHDCALDKKSNKGVSRLEDVTFLRLQNVAELPPERQGNLRGSAGRFQPYEAMYLGRVSDLGECYVMLTAPYTLPAQIFRPELREYDEGSSAGEPGVYLTPTDFDSRVAKLSADGLDLLRKKWMIQWTRMQPKP